MRYHGSRLDLARYLRSGQHSKELLALVIATIVGAAVFSFLTSTKRYYLPATLEIEGSFDPQDAFFIGWQAGGSFQEFLLRASQTSTISQRLPQIKIQTLQVRSERSFRARVKLNNGNFMSPGTSDGKSAEFRNVHLATQGFHPLLMGIHLSLSVVVAWCSYSIGKAVSSSGIALSARTIRHLLSRYWLFWILLLFSTLVFLTWLLGHWPAIMSVDSLHVIWRESKTLHFPRNLKPWTYLCYVAALRQLWDSPAMIALFQLLATAFLGSAAFSFTYSRGAGAWIVIPCYLLFVFSIPVGIYNVTIWSDIPFSILMLAWGLLLFYLYYKRLYQGTTASFGTTHVLVLSLLFCALCTFRHNGIIFVPFIPLLVCFLRLLKRRAVLHFLAFSFSLLFLVYYFGPESGGVRQWAATTRKFFPLAAMLSAKDYYSPDYETDRKIAGEWMSEAELADRFTPLPHDKDYWEFRRKWDRLGKEQKRYLSGLYYRRGLQNLPIFLANRLHFVLGTMGMSPRVNVTSRTLEWHKGRGEYPSWWSEEAFGLEYSPKVLMLAALQKRLLKKCLAFAGEVPLPMIIFNAFPGALLLMIALCLYKWYPCSALYAAVFLYNVPFLALGLHTVEFRFFYFLLLSAFFVPPLMALEHAARSRRAGALLQQ